MQDLRHYRCPSYIIVVMLILKKKKTNRLFLDRIGLGNTRKLTKLSMS